MPKFWKLFSPEDLSVSRLDVADGNKVCAKGLHLKFKRLTAC